MADRKTCLYGSNRSCIWKVELASKPAFVSKEFTASSADSSLEIGFHSDLKAIPGVVGYSGCSYGESPMLLMELCEHGSLKAYLEGLKEPMSEERLLLWYRSMAKTVRLMHAERVAHRVISADNWLVTNDLQVKLTDFGHAIKLNVIHSGCTESTSLRGESPGLRTKHIFAEDALRLARVFYQMATFDFNVAVWNVQCSDIGLMCRQRGYSEQVRNSICHLLQLRNISASRQAEVGEILQHLEMMQTSPDIPSLQDLEDSSYLCSLCKSAEGRYQFPCEHWICETCQKRMMRCSNSGTEQMCELCASVDSSPQLHREVVAQFDFSLVDFSIK